MAAGVDGARRLWRIGELAAASGVSVRTLHHYEQVGLLRPSTRTTGGHRLYDEEGVRALYRIRALRELGLPLREVGEVLESADTRVAGLLTAHIARVDEQIERLVELRERLQGTRRQVDGVVGAEALLATIEAMNRVSTHVLRRRGDASSAPGAAGTENRWRLAGQELRCLMDAGIPASDRRTTRVALRIQKEIRSFAADDWGVLAALAHLRRTGADIDLAGWDRPLMDYLDRALPPD
jgi:DNA-binding transcriptional MerR regulator